MPPASANNQKIGDYYYSCMDEAGIEAKGTKPVQPMLDRINALKDKSELPALIGQMHSAGANVLFAFGSEPDAKDSKMEIAGTDQGGLGLPDRDYYLKDDAKSAEIRKQVRAARGQHVQARGRFTRQSGSRSQDRDAGGDRAGQGLAGPHRASRSQQGLPQDDDSAASGAESRLQVERVFRRRSRAPSSAASTFPCPTS